METLQQRMAIKAYENVEAFGKDHADDKARNKYAGMAHKLPVLIHNAGLAQSLAFVQSRKPAEQKLLLNHLAATIEFPGVTDGASLLRLSREAPLMEYMLLTRRVLSALVWYKRFVEGLFGIRANEANLEADGESAPSGE
jgi:CRISPR-associated protein Cmr5